jgi:hypothetical protein
LSETSIFLRRSRLQPQAFHATGPAHDIPARQHIGARHCSSLTIEIEVYTKCDFSGTQKALFHLSQGTCYYPECATRVIVFVEQRPIVNVHISHIRGALPGSPKYDTSMSDEERSSFTNLLLLCKPHHDLVDRIEPDRYPAETLEKWKAAREEMRQPN